MLDPLDEKSCPICLDEKEDMYITDCDHKMCKDCLDEWFDKNKTSCPLCRTDMRYIHNDDEKIRIVSNRDTSVEDEDIQRTTLFLQHLVSKVKLYRYMMYFSTVSSLISINYYFSTAATASQYLQDYNNCNSSYIELEKHINSIHASPMSDNMIDLRIWKDDTSHLCYIPEKYLNRCFE